METPRAHPDRMNLKETIDKESRVDEASWESFPASDPPSFAGGSATPEGSHESEDRSTGKADHGTSTAD
jgi:hypothetical protein